MATKTVNVKMMQLGLPETTLYDYEPDSGEIVRCNHDISRFYIGVGGGNPPKIGSYNHFFSAINCGTLILCVGDIPSGYIFCNGAAISRISYSRLFQAIGTHFGSGNGSTTFNLPDYRDKFICGETINSSSILASTGGQNSLSLSVSNMPSHTHGLEYGLNTSAPGNTVTVMAGGTTYVSTNPIKSAGSGSAFDNRPAYVKTKVAIRY